MKLHTNISFDDLQAQAFGVRTEWAGSPRSFETHDGMVTVTERDGYCELQSNALTTKRSISCRFATLLPADLYRPDEKTI